MGTAAILGLIIAITGAAMNQYATYKANKAAQSALNDAMYQLNEEGKGINDKILEASQSYESDKRVAGQEEEAKRIASDIKGDVAASQALRDESQATSGNVSNDYKEALAKSQEKTAMQSDAFADLVGKIRSAGALRQQEGFNLARTGQEVDKLARNARGNWQVGQVRVNDALHSKDGLKAAGQITQAIGSLMMMGAGSAASAGSNAGTVGATGAELGSIGSGAATYGSSAATGAASAQPFVNDFGRFFANGAGSAFL